MSAIRLTILCLLVLPILGCRPTAPIESVSTPTMTLAEATPATATAEPSPTSTALPTPTRTVTPSPEPSPTATALPSPTPEPHLSLTVRSLTTGAPLPDAAVSIYDASDALLGELETNEEGIAILSLPAGTYTVHISLAGFCDIDTTIASDLSIEPAVVSLEPGTCVRVTAQTANLRSGPDTAYPVSGQLQSGALLRVTGLSEDGAWLWVEGQEEMGWISRELVQTPELVSSLPTVPAPPLPTPPPATATAPVALPAPQPVIVGGNLLINPGFESGAEGWTLRQVTSADSGLFIDVVTADGEPASVYAGHAAGKLAAANFMVYQEVRTAVPGATYRLGAWVRLWSSTGGNREVSENPDPIRAMICLSTVGSHIVDAPHAVCSAATGTLDQWIYLTTEATAQTETLSAVLWLLACDTPNRRYMVGDASWDEISLSLVAGTP